MERHNCWEFMSCGRQPGGSREKELGICPAAIYTSFEGVHGGKAAGRACWAVAGTMCIGDVSGVYALELRDCRKCEFYDWVRLQENGRLMLTIDLLNLIHNRGAELPSGCHPPQGIPGDMEDDKDIS